MYCPFCLTIFTSWGFLSINQTVDAEQAAQKKIGQLEAEVHDRDMTIMELKAKLYDLMMKEGK